MKRRALEMLSDQQRIPNRRLLSTSVASWMLVGLTLTGFGLARAQALNSPRRIAEGPPGQVLVTDRGNGSVVAVRKDDLEPVWSFPLPDEGAPFGLATWNRLVFVGNTETKNVEVYRMQGSPKGGTELRFEYNLGFSPRGAPGSIENPIAIAVDRKLQLVFVLDGRQKSVKIFDRKGAFLEAFIPADEAGEVMSPVSLAIDEARQEVLVSDYGDPRGSFRAREAARILIYDYAGNLLFQIDGDRSTHPTTQFVRVQGISTSRDGKIFVADALGGRILVLDRTSGELLAEIGIEGQQPGELMLPLDVHLDERTGDLFVVNNQGARRLEVFRGEGR